MYISIDSNGNKKDNNNLKLIVDLNIYYYINKIIKKLKVMTRDRFKKNPS